ncbi:hypothetical protein E0F67_10385, partial [Streptococcus pyogenes]
MDLCRGPHVPSTG